MAVDSYMGLESFSGAVRQLLERMDPCVLCPRMCGARRGLGGTGFCGAGDLPIVSSAGPHLGEESVLVGAGGSGTIFFAGCNLGCVYCQNADISRSRCGDVVSIDRLAGIMLELQRAGCVNINLVSPTHIIGPIAAAIELARPRGLTVPIVYNTGGFDSVETLSLLDGLIDIYMPDMKYADPMAASRLSMAYDYPKINREAVREMHRQVGDLQTHAGVAVRGLLVRHLVLPNDPGSGSEIIDFLADEISCATAVNIMDQYHPAHHANSHPDINRRVTQEEFQRVRDYALERGLQVLS